VPASPKAAVWHAIETVRYVWLENGVPYSVIVEEAPAEDSPRLRIAREGQPDFILALRGGLVKLKESFLGNADLLALNALNSAYLFLPRNLKSAEGTPLLIVTGWAYGSDPGSFRALSLHIDGAPYEVFSSDTFDLTDLVDLDADGLTEIIGKHTLSQQWGRCFTTYDPFSVYRLASSSTGKATLALHLSKTYNLSHYYGWVGPNSSEDWAVVLCAPGKPIIVKSKDAERMFDK
jgi:hypothetical protein